jgi:hypothetical protein
MLAASWSTPISIVQPHSNLTWEGLALGHITSAECASIERTNIRAAFTTRNAAAPGTGIPEEVEDMIFHPAKIVASKLK